MGMENQHGESSSKGAETDLEKCGWADFWFFEFEESYEVFNG